MAERLAALTHLPVERISAGLDRAQKEGLVAMSGGVALLHWRETGIDRPAALLVRHSGQIADDLAESASDGPDALDSEGSGAAMGIIVLVSPDEDPAQHLRLLGHLATQVAEPGFADRWHMATGNDRLRATLMREERTLTIVVGGGEGVPWAGRALRTLTFPPDTLVALVRRTSGAIVPNGETVLETGDRLTVIGTPEGIEAMIGDLDDTAEVVGGSTAPGAPKGEA